LKLIHNTINYLKEKNIGVFRLSHCTGDKAVGRLEDEFREKFIYNNTGNVIEVD
jgi:Metal-dependent hydrolases of the beta-lactamase superfamily II